ncbi:MAG: hypothetical protein ACK5Q5_04025 [Planctomycetaceae bacterium]
MYRAIAVKELREVWWIGLLMAAAVTLQTLRSLGLQSTTTPPFFEWIKVYYDMWIQPVPFQGEDWPATLLLVGMLGGGVLGLWQTLGESVQGTWAFYLYRPADRESLVLGKLLVGLPLVLVCLGLPMLLFALWAATPGTHGSPFEWWLLRPSIRAWGFGSVGYLAGFLCGLRPARWWASRFLPAVAVSFLWLTVLASPWWEWPGWLAIGVSDVLLLLAIFEIARQRDWA